MISTPAFALSEDLASTVKRGSSVHNAKKNCLFKTEHRNPSVSSSRLKMEGGHCSFNLRTDIWSKPEWLESEGFQKPLHCDFLIKSSYCGTMQQSCVCALCENEAVSWLLINFYVTLRKVCGKSTSSLQSYQIQNLQCYSYYSSNTYD